MVEINLLPWRQARKKRDNRWVVGGFSVAIVLPLFLIAGTSRYLEACVLHQQRRNQQLERAMLQLSPALQQITNLKASRLILLKQRHRQYMLQSTRQNEVHLLYDIAHAVPKGVSLTQLELKNGQVTLHGDASSPNRVTHFMHRIALTDQLRKPTLLEMKKVDYKQAFALQFVTPHNRHLDRNRMPSG